MHYIRLVVLGDSQVGKTSLIRQLVGEELKFEPELRSAGKLEAGRADWHDELTRHEVQVERAVETTRLASLLSSQIELQQLLLQQQRGNNEPANFNSTTSDLQQQLKSTQKSTALATNKQRQSIQEESVNGTCQVKQQQQREMGGQLQPTILISAFSASNRSLNSNCSNNPLHEDRQRRQSTCSVTSVSGTATTERAAKVSGACQSGQLELKRTLSAEPISSKTTATTTTTTLPSNDPLPFSDLSCAHKSNANHVPRELHSKCSEKGATCDSAVAANGTKQLNNTPVVLATANFQSCSLKQNSLAEPSSSSTANQQHLHLANQLPHSTLKPKHRHSYCSPGELSDSESAEQGNKVTSQLNIKQQQQQQQQQPSEISTQAKIINILFTRNEPKTSSNETAQNCPPGVGTAIQVTQLQTANTNSQQIQTNGSNSNSTSEERPPKSSSRPLLMPSLLRQYQRRLSNFHQSSSGSSGSAENRGGVAADPTARPGDDGSLPLEEQQRRAKAASAAAQAAGQLARAAASAAQALLSSDVPLASELVGVASPPATRPSVGVESSQLSLYALTAECRRELMPIRNEQRREKAATAATTTTLTFLKPTSRVAPPLVNSKSSSSIGSSSHPIRHFFVNYINNMDLYELDIVDMPTIEPIAFPTSSLLEWSLFKGRSHLLTADAYLLVFDLTRPSTIQYIKTLRDKIFESREMSHVPVYVIANKADLCPTLQPSLQARRLRNVAVQRHQAGSLLAPTQQQQQQPSAALTSPPSSQLTATNPKLGSGNQSSSGAMGNAHQDAFNCSIPGSAAHQLLAAYKAHRMRLGRAGPIVSLRRWATLRTAIVKPSESGAGFLGAPLGSVGAANQQQSAAAQWLQFERTRLHYSLIVGAASGHHGDSLGNQWSSSLGRAFKRFKSCVGRRFQRLRSSTDNPTRYPNQTDSRRNQSARSRRRSMATLPNNSSQSRSHSRRQRSSSGDSRRHRRRRKTNRRRGRHQHLDRNASLNKSGAESGTRTTLGRWFRRSDKCPTNSSTNAATANSSRSPLSGLATTLYAVAASTKLRLKRKRADQSDSGASRSGSMQSVAVAAAAATSSSTLSGKKKRKPTSESNFRQYSKLLTSAAKQVVPSSSNAEPPTITTTLVNVNNKSVSLSSDTPAAAGTATNSANAAETVNQTAQNVAEAALNQQPLVEPICGAMSTPSSRQRFYELFNRLLQTSSTAAAKTQLKLGSVSSSGDATNADNNQTSGDPTQQPPLSTDRTGILQIRSPVGFDATGAGGKNLIGIANNAQATKRRKSSSTGAALWQTLSNYALSRTSRSSIGSNQSAATDVHSIRGRDSVTTLTRVARAEHELQQSRRASGQQLAAEGLHLGTDTYLSVDMLRKLSLISAHSQTSAGGVGSGLPNGIDLTDAADTAEQRSQSALPNMEPSASEKKKRNSSGASQSSATAAAPGNSAATAGKRPSTATPTARSGFKQIWYRSVVKKILFQSNKRQSFRAVVTAMELQHKADKLDSEEQLEQQQQQQLDNTEMVQCPKQPEEQVEVGVDAARKESKASEKQLALRVLEPMESQRKESLSVNSQSATAPSIRIITSGSSLSLMSADRSGGCAATAAAAAVAAVASTGTGRGANVGVLSGENSILATKSQAGGNFEGRDQNNESTIDGSGNVGRENQADSPATKRLRNQQLAPIKRHVDLSAVPIDDTNINQDLAELEVNGSDLNKQQRQRRLQSEPADRCVSPLSVSSSLSGSSLSNSVSISLTTTIADQRQQQLSSRAQSAAPVLNATNQNNQLDSITENPSASAQEVAEKLRKERLLDFMLQPQVVGPTARKLSADDCLIINRQRRNSLAAAAAAVRAAGGAGEHQLSVAGEMPSQGWLSFATTNAGAADIDGQVRPATAGAGDASDAAGGSDSRRQSVKATVEAAIHLLVPRAKGSRSASITLGVIPDEQRSFSQLGTSIMGAVNVHRTWRDWRQLLGKRKAPTANHCSAATEAAVSGFGGKSDALTAASDSLQASGLEPDSRAAGFLSSHWAFSRLTVDQQREAAINFDQLMRVNQLTLSAANAVMLSSGTAASDKQTRPLADDTHQQLVRESGVQLGENGLSLTPNSAINSKKQSKRNQGEPLMTRLQSGGNLLLKRASSRREAGLPVRRAADIAQSSDFQQQQQQTVTQLSSSSAVPMMLSQELDKQQKQTVPTATLAPSSSEIPRIPISETDVSAQIAAAAASALDKQKRRGEEISMILEPRYDKKQPGAQYPLFVSNDLNPILKDLAQLVRKHWKCNYIECSAASNWNIMPIMSELTRTLECNQQLRSNSQVNTTCATSSSSSFSSSCDSSSMSSFLDSSDSERNRQLGSGDDSEEESSDDDEDDHDHHHHHQQQQEIKCSDDESVDLNCEDINTAAKSVDCATTHLSSSSEQFFAGSRPSDAGSASSLTTTKVQSTRKCQRTASTGARRVVPDLRISSPGTDMNDQCAVSAGSKSPLPEQQPQEKVEVEEQIVVGRRRKVRLHCATKQQSDSQHSSQRTTNKRRRKSSSFGSTRRASSTNFADKQQQQACSIM